MLLRSECKIHVTTIKESEGWRLGIFRWTWWRRLYFLCHPVVYVSSYWPQWLARRWLLIVQPKCELYWPETAGQEKVYSDIGVTLMDTEQTADFVVRTFQVRRDTDSRHVKHFHYTAWPDHGVPNFTGPIISFRRKVRLYDETHPGPVIVHCR